MEQTDTLAAVRKALRERVGDLRIVAEESGVSYDTVLRIKNEEGDPGYSKVKALAVHLRIPVVACRPTRAQREPRAATSKAGA